MRGLEYRAVLPEGTSKASKLEVPEALKAFRSVFRPGSPKSSRAQGLRPHLLTDAVVAQIIGPLKHLNPETPTALNPPSVHPYNPEIRKPKNF